MGGFPALRFEALRRFRGLDVNCPYPKTSLSRGKASDLCGGKDPGLLQPGANRRGSWLSCSSPENFRITQGLCSG